jgi:ADP-ribosylglycohydrolase
MSSASLHSRIRGMLHGVALGDALGATVEKMTAAEIRARHGRVTSLDAEWNRATLSDAERGGRIRGHGIVTDDTLMTICLMNIYGELRRHLDAWDMASAFVREIAWKPRWIPEMQRETMLIERLFHPEKWIFVRHQLAGCEPREGGIGNMVNCGAAMYIAPIGAANACDPVAAYAEAIAFASGHQASYGLEAAGVMAACVAAAFKPGISVAEIVQTALDVAKDGTRSAIAAIASDAASLRGRSHDDVTARFHATIAAFSPIGDNVYRRSEAAGVPTQNYRPSRLQSIEELPIALGFCLVNDGEFRRSIEDGVNSGRDTDSIGCMIGAILGAMHGEDEINRADADLLDQANRMDLAACAEQFTGVVRDILSDDEKRLKGILAARHALCERAGR